jgi:hypothetical protein
MFFLVYVSTSVGLFSPAELTDILEKARVNNARLDITGMLLYKDGNLMQVLEGEEQAVRALYAKIATDPRHRGLMVILQGSQQERQFPDWSMGCRDLNSVDALSTPGYSEFLNTPLTGEEFSSEPARSQKLLLTFKRSM